MNNVAPMNSGGEYGDRSPRRLPIRWALIATWTAAAATAAFLLVGPIPAIMAGCAVATAAHRLLD